MKEQCYKQSPALARVVAMISRRAGSREAAAGWHTDAHTDGGGGSWHGDAWRGVR